MQSKILQFPSFSFYALCGSLLLMLYFLTSCEDKCNTYMTFTKYTPIYKNKTEIRNGVAVKSAQNLQKPGKIYSFGNFIFINEIETGVHIIDNSSPSNPQKIAFVQIPGNVDIAVKDNFLYADSYMDLLVFDITQPQQIALLKRVENVFPFYTDATDEQKVLIKWNEEQVTEKVNSNCEPTNNIWTTTFDIAAFNGNGIRTQMSATPSNARPVGRGGSLARFAIHQDYLYTVDNSRLQVFELNDPASPQNLRNITVGWGIETIYPYQDKLFIGSQTGMFIFENQDPSNPTYISGYSHWRACDPVVVEGNYAYVTLRSGQPVCGGTINQLDVLDISNIQNPVLLKTYPMQNPHGLGIDNQTLFVCEGEYGLKVFDAQKPLQINANLLQHIRNITFYDVIPLGINLLAVGKDGLYQYDYSNPQNLKLLSKLPIVK